MDLRVELDRETDGRWIGEVPELPGVLVYGQTREQAVSKVAALALRVLADQVENGTLRSEGLAVTFSRPVLVEADDDASCPE
jgi:predicted RNase H-like HicB family nuclease